MTLSWCLRLISLAIRPQADHPTDKSVRAARDAMAHTVLVHDASYTGVVELVGTLDALAAVLTPMTDPAGPRIAAQR